MPHSDAFARSFADRLRSRPQPAEEAQESAYYYHNEGDAEALVTRSVPLSFQLGTGLSIYHDRLLPAMRSARREIILVTCFWAESATLVGIREALEGLAAQRRRTTDEGGALAPLRVRICLSSSGLFQKLFHTSSRDGYTYPPATWTRKLGLPDASTLEAAGIELRVKSLFFLPFSVMHPKFVIVDGQRAFLPSCNVSWETWLEGCVEITGDAVAGLVAFYSRTWDRREPGQAADLPGPAPEAVTADDTTGGGAAGGGVGVVVKWPRADRRPLPTILLPSPHHRYPRFRPFPWQRAPAPPLTPLNVALLQLFELAKQHVYVQTPDLTCDVVLSALLDAVRRGVDVHVVTNRNMMLFEQLLTAGTINSWCVRASCVGTRPWGPLG